ncbi:MAG TPA: winged helix-turn-helix domain-containing protein, partial [Candidatus Acidoferrum sp.]|nr:winged helix-turn-helix domain-containing protein [Candidatus Acidoferrum sp.]
MEGFKGLLPRTIRRRLADIVLAELPRVVLCIAPAGFGKTTLAQQLAGDTAGTFIIDDACTRPDAQEIVERACADEPIPLVVVCARLPFHLPFEVARPSDVLAFEAAELRFTPAETAALFEPELDDATLARVERYAAGWPAALGVLARRHRVGALGAALEGESAEIELLEHYAARELPQFDESRIEALIGEVAAGELDGTLLAAAVRRVHRVRLDAAIDRALEDAERVGEPLRAARLAILHGRHRRAAELLRDVVRTAEPAPTAETIALVERLPRAAVLSQPALWDRTMLYRRYQMTHDAWLSEALERWHSLGDDVTVEELAAVFRNVGVVYVVQGRWDELATFHAAYLARIVARGATEHPHVRATEAFSDGYLAVGRGRTFDADRFLRDAAPLLGADLFHAIALYDIVSRAALLRGDRAAQRAALEQATHLAARSGVVPLAAAVHEEAAFAAFIAGEEALFAHHRGELERLVDANPSLRIAYAFFLSAVRGEPLPAAPATERPSSRILALVLAAARTPDLAERKIHLDRAVREAARCGHVLPAVVAYTAREAAGPGETTALRELQRLAATAEIPLLRAHFAPAHGGSPLEPLLRRFRPPDQREGIVVEIFSGTVRAGGTAIRLAPKEFALLAYLALSAVPLERDAIVDALWPDGSSTDPIATLRVYVNRVRARLGHRDAVL